MMFGLLLTSKDVCPICEECPQSVRVLDAQEIGADRVKNRSI